MSSSPTRLPFLPLFVSDFFGATVSWDGEERALYALLLMHEWLSGPLAADTARLAKIIGYDTKRFGKLWRTVGQKFVRTSTGDLINERLEEHRRRVLEKTEKNAQSGRLGAAKRWADHRAADGERHSERHSSADGERHPDAIASADSIQNQNQNENPPLPRRGRDRDLERESRAAWQSALQFAREGRYRHNAHPDQRVVETVQRLGGFVRIAQSTDAGLRPLMSQFREMYQDVAANPPVKTSA